MIPSERAAGVRQAIEVVRAFQRVQDDLGAQFAAGEILQRLEALLESIECGPVVCVICSGFVIDGVCQDCGG